MVDATAIELSPPGSALGAQSALEVLTAVSDPVRWAVLARLACGEACVCELQRTVPVAANLLSYHLKTLREAGLVTTRRRGRWIDYRLAGDAHERLAAALPTATAGAQSSAGGERS